MKCKRARARFSWEQYLRLFLPVEQLVIENTSNPCYYHAIVHLLKNGHLHSMYLTDLQVSLLPCKYIRWAGNQTVRNFFWFNFFYFTMKVMGVTFIRSLEKSLAPRHFWQPWIMYIPVCIQYQQLLHCNYVECECGVHVQCIIICVWYDTNSWYLFIYFSHFE